jgi:hypothetical protein
MIHDDESVANALSAIDRHIPEIGNVAIRQLAKS